jgi:hypothetical protein
MTALGFGPSPRPRTIYINRQYPECLWYFWNGAKSIHEPIEHGSITAYLTKIELTEKEFRGKPDTKIDLHLKADRAYKIQVGIDTLTAKSLLSALTKVEDFSQPITIAPEPGDTDQVCFARVSIDGGEIIYAPYADDADWPAILQALIDRLGGEAPQAITETPRPVEAPLPKLGPPKFTTAPPTLPVLPPPSNAPSSAPKTISDSQRKLFAKLARDAAWEVVAIKAYLGSCGYDHSSTIAPKDFEGICEGLSQPDIQAYFHRVTEITADQALPLGTWEDAA